MCGLQVFYLVPVIGICFNIFPVNNSFWFALAFTLYIVMIQVGRGVADQATLLSSALRRAAASRFMATMCLLNLAR